MSRSIKQESSPAKRHKSQGRVHHYQGHQVNIDRTIDELLMLDSPIKPMEVNVKELVNAIKDCMTVHGIAREQTSRGRVDLRVTISDLNRVRPERIPSQVMEVLQRQAREPVERSLFEYPNQAAKQLGLGEASCAVDRMMRSEPIANGKIMMKSEVDRP